MLLDTLFTLSPEYREADERWGAFLRERIRPGAAQRDLDFTMIPNRLFREAADLGLVGFAVPREVGGGGANWWTYGQALESVAYNGDDASFCMLLAYRETAARLVYQSQNSYLIDEYVVPHVRGESFMGWAFTEKADLFSLETRSDREGSGYRVTGLKQAVTGGLGDDSFLVYARNEEGSDYRVLLVRKDDPGVTVTPRPAMGFRANGLAMLKMENVFVPEERVVSATDGLSHAQLFVGERRLTLASWAPGRLISLIERVVEALSPLERGGAPVLDAKSTQAELGKMVIGTEEVRAISARMLHDADNGALPSALSITLGKHIGATKSIEVAHTAHRILGGMAYWCDTDFDRYIRDFYGLLPIIGGPVVIEVDLGSRAIEHYAMAKRRRL